MKKILAMIGLLLFTLFLGVWIGWGWVFVFVLHTMSAWFVFPLEVIVGGYGIWGIGSFWQDIKEIR